jgi:hypothetical protein
MQPSFAWRAVRSLVLPIGPHQLSVSDADQVLDFDGTVTAVGDIAVGGAGLVSLNAPSSIVPGGIHVASGKLQATNATFDSGPSVLTVDSGAQLIASDFGTLTRPVHVAGTSPGGPPALMVSSMSGSLVLDGGTTGMEAHQTVSGPISGSGNLQLWSGDLAGPTATPVTPSSTASALSAARTPSGSAPSKSTLPGRSPCKET